MAYLTYYINFILGKLKKKSLLTEIVFIFIQTSSCLFT